MATPGPRGREDDIDDPPLRGSSKGSALALVESAAALLELPLPGEDAEVIADLLSGLLTRTTAILQQDGEPFSPVSPGVPW